MMSVRHIWYDDDGLHLLDQTLLPVRRLEIVCETPQKVWEAIKMLRVRGAPAIGVAAAFGVVVGAARADSDQAEVVATQARDAADYLATSRPTAVNLFWALDRMRRCIDTCLRDQLDARALLDALRRQAQSIQDEDDALCRAIGRHGAELVPAQATLITHCNAGALATSGYGTALGVVYAAVEAGKQVAVYADETRPLLQGARLTAWELQQQGVPVTVIADSMAGHVLRDKKIDLVVVGADRIAANGDTANKIGTYSLAVLAKEHGVPFYVAAPTTTVDLATPTGAEIPIEERDPAEIGHGFGVDTTPPGVECYNPAFDVTPARYIAGIITEHGIARPPFDEALRAMVQASETVI